MYRKICGVMFALLISVSCFAYTTEFNADSTVKTIHYYNGERPESGTTGNLIGFYDGCNWHTRINDMAYSTTCLACSFTDGQTVKTLSKYKVSDTLFVVIHSEYIYHDFNIMRW